MIYNGQLGRYQVEMIFLVFPVFLSYKSIGSEMLISIIFMLQGTKGTSFPY